MVSHMKKFLLATLLLATPALATYTPQAIITDAVSGKMATVDSSNALKVAGTVNIGTTGGLALDATLSALSAKLPVALGAHSIANSTAVNIASDQVVPVSIGSLPLPSGGATSALQTTGNTSLASIDSTLSTLNGKVTAVNTGAVVVASSALPAGAATAAKQPALGTAGTASADVITVQGVTSMVPLKVDGSGVTQPVSAVALPLPAGAATSALQGTGNTSLASIDGKIVAVNTGAVVVASSALPSGAATAANQSTEISSLATIATNTTNAGTPTVSGTVTVIQGTPGVGAWPVLAAQAGSWSTTVTQATGSNLHVVSDAGSAIIGKVGIDQTTPGTTNGVQVNAALPAGSNLIGKTGIDQTTPGTTNKVYIGTDGVVGISGTVPLPTGAATEATLSTLNGKVTAVNTGAVVISSSALPSGAATESTLSTLSGKVPSNLTVTSTRLLVDGSGVTQPISAASLPLPSGASTDVAIGSTTSGETGALVQGAVTTSAPTYVTAKTNPLSLNTSGGLRVDGSGVTQPVSIATAPVLVAGSAIIGKVGIDQTTPGTTNGVQVNAALPAGSAVIGKVSIDQTTPGTTNLVALAANQSVNVAQINGVTPLMGAGNTGTGSARVTIATDQAAVAVKPAIAVTGSGSAAAATVSTVITASAPSNAVGFILMNLDTSTANIRWAVGRTATTTLGQQLQPGRDTGYVPIGASVTIVAESGTQNYDIQWIAQ